jgi:hypothetical protein
MKERTGFVSNSSSSSFILAAKETPKIKVELTYNDFEEFSTLEEYNGWLEEHWGVDVSEIIAESDYQRKEYDRIKAVFERGDKIYIGEVSSDDCDNLASMELYNTGCPESDKYEVIRDEN